MRRLVFAFLSVAVAFCANGETLFGKDVSVPVRLIVGMTYKGNGYVIPLYNPADGEQLQNGTIGGWDYQTKYYKDVREAVDEAAVVYDILMDTVVNPPVPNPDEGPIAVADCISAMREVLGLNQLAINWAMQKKQNKILEAISSASSESEDNQGSDAVKDLAKLTADMERVQSSINKLSGVDSTLNDRLALVEQAASRNSMTIIELRKQIEASVPSAEVEAMKRQVAELYEQISSYKEQSGLLTLAIKNLQDMRQMMQVPMAVVAIPPEVGTYSNQISRLNRYIGSESSDGMFALPDIQLEADQFDDSDPLLNPSDDEEAGKIQLLLRWLWEAGFVPHMPYEADGELGGAADVMWGGRYFWDEEDGSGNTVTHAVGISMPVEWSVNTAWQYDATSNMWINAHVQFGNSSDAGSGTYDAIAGANWARCDLSAKTITIVEADGGTSDPKYRYFYIGTITDGRITDGVFYTPIIFMWE